MLTVPAATVLVPSMLVTVSNPANPNTRISYTRFQLLFPPVSRFLPYSLPFPSFQTGSNIDVLWGRYHCLIETTCGGIIGCVATRFQGKSWRRGSADRGVRRRSNSKPLVRRLSSAARLRSAIVQDL